jgi:hypothetical protein
MEQIQIYPTNLPHITYAEVISLLARGESPTLEFKRELYQLDGVEKESKKARRDEFIKDILALANGNSVVAGDKAVLIIGANNEKNEDGSRTLFDVGQHRLTAQRILDLVNPACEPAIEDIYCDDISVDGKNLLVITIPPTPYLYETTRRLEVPKSENSKSQTTKVYSERTVFVRHKEGIEIASGKERDAIARIKRFRFDESKNPPAMPFGAIVGGLVGGAFAYGIAKKPDSFTKHPKEAGIAAALVGSWLGASFGSLYKNIYEFRSMWITIPSSWRLPFLGTLIGLTFVMTKLINFLIGLLPKSKE